MQNGVFKHPHSVVLHNDARTHARTHARTTILSPLLSLFKLLNPINLNFFYFITFWFNIWFRRVCKGGGYRLSSRNPSNTPLFQEWEEDVHACMQTARKTTHSSRELCRKFFKTLSARKTDKLKHASIHHNQVLGHELFQVYCFARIFYDV